MALDQIKLERERLHLAVDEHDVKVVDALDHRAHPRRLPALRAEILPHAVFQVDRLADIDDLSLGLHQIAARGIRQIVDFQIEFF